MRGHHALTETKSSFKPVTVVSRNSQSHLHFTNSRLTVVSISEIRLLSSQTQRCSEGGITSLSVQLIRVEIILFILKKIGGGRGEREICYFGSADGSTFRASFSQCLGYSRKDGL